MQKILLVAPQEAIDVASFMVHYRKHEDFSAVDVVGIPSQPDNRVFPCVLSMLHGKYNDAVALLEHDPNAAAVIIFSRGLVSSMEGTSTRVMFSVGTILTRFRGGMSELFSLPEWVPKDYQKTFEKDADIFLGEVHHGLLADPNEGVQHAKDVIEEELCTNMDIPVIEQRGVVH